MSKSPRPTLQAEQTAPGLEEQTPRLPPGQEGSTETEGIGRAQEPLGGIVTLEDMAWVSADSTLAHVHIAFPGGWGPARDVQASKTP